MQRQTGLAGDGYDDCFPSVEESIFPGFDWKVPDHGEVCWLNWDINEAENKLLFSVKSKVLPVQLKRKMIFKKSSINWNFEVCNDGSEKIPFQHVMHPLMKLDEISGFYLPEFKSVYNKTTDQELNLKKPLEVQEYLMNKPRGTATMLFLRHVNEGKMSWTYKNGLLMKVTFSKELFPSIGIWWNNMGYPDETGIRRNECAFEPIPGLTSSISEAFNDDYCLYVSGNNKIKWQIIWELFS